MIAFLNWLDGVLWGVPLIALMILTGLYFTVLDYEENRRKTVPERRQSK